MLFSNKDIKQLKDLRVEDTTHFLRIMQNKRVYINSPRYTRKNNWECIEYTFKVEGITFSYSEGLGIEQKTKENQMEKIVNALWCILRESLDIDNYYSYYDFSKEFGYDFTEGQKIYNQIKRNRNKLLRIFRESEIEDLYNCYSENY